MTSLMGAKTRAEPEVIYYLLQVQERALARVASGYDATCIQYNLYCTPRGQTSGGGRRGGGVGVGVPLCLSLLVVTAWRLAVSRAFR